MAISASSEVYQCFADTILHEKISPDPSFQNTSALPAVECAKHGVRMQSYESFDPVAGVVNNMILFGSAYWQPVELKSMLK